MRTRTLLFSVLVIVALAFTACAAPVAAPAAPASGVELAGALDVATGSARTAPEEHPVSETVRDHGKATPTGFPLPHAG